jgi:hypothetical protein
MFKKHTNQPALEPLKQSDMIKTLELIRLKSSWIKLQQTGAKFKTNIRICIRMAKFLQHIWENLSGLSSTTEAQTCSPREKSYYLKKYVLAYWNYVCKQLIKLKQLESLDEELTQDMDASRRKSEVFNNLNESVAYKNYFDYLNESSEDEEIGCNKENESLQDQYDNIIQTGVLCLIIDHVSCLNDPAGATGPSEEDVDSVVASEASLDEAIALFNLMENSLSEKSRNEQLSFSHLQQCKKVS